MAVTLGLERLIEMGPDALGGRRIGLVTNQTGVDRLLRRNVDLMRDAGFDLVALFGPEHGVRGEAQAGVLVADGRDPWSDLPTYSLYGKTKKPAPRMLEGVEALVLDLWDIGARYFTYPYTMAYCMEAACEARMPIYVLDRPNPVSGTAMEGNLLEPGFESFVGLFPIPMRHGMTLGELAGLFNQEFSIGCELTVIPCVGWQRQMYWPDTGLPFIPSSPNTTGVDMALLYSGTCLFEGTNWSEGRGTTRPLEVIGAPWVDGWSLAHHLNEMGLPGVRFRPTFFTPTFSKHQGAHCQGVQVHVLDPRACLPVLTGLMMVESAFRLWPEQTNFLTPHFDHLAGTAAVREALTRGKPIKQVYDSWKAGLESFARQRARYLLYH